MSINLDNFEVDEFTRDTPFVLTSPTSLEACAQLDIEPLELVYQSLEHFEETCCHLPLSQVYRIYEEAETNRQAKLLQCREQRKSLLVERARKSLTLSSNYCSNNNLNNRTSSLSSPTSASINNNNSSSRPPTSGSGASTMKKKSSSATSVRVNFTRNDLQQEKQHQQQQRRSGSTMSKVKNSNSIGNTISRGRSAYTLQQNHCTSDTESNDETLLLLQSPRNCADCDSGNYYPMSSRSVPDLRRGASRGNLDFRKVAQSASWSTSPRRHYCLCHVELRDQDILSEYFKRYDDILSTNDLSEEDRKILERLILKRAKMLEWDKQSQELREILEIDRAKKYRASQMLAQQWADKLAEKRRLENLENHQRFLRIQDKLERQQQDLRHYLDERDKRIQKYLEDISFKKKKGMVEKQRLEALRQLEVSKAIERMLEEDKQKRQSMRDRLQNRIKEAEVRKRRREQDYWRHVSDMNRLDDMKRALKMEKVEQKAKATVEELRHQIEEKEHRVKLNQLRNLQIREKSLESGSLKHQRAIEKARKLHEELLTGFDEWNRKALELQIAAQERAGLKHCEEINRRRARAASERILREERTSEMLKRVQQMEEKRKELMKEVIETKNVKSQRVRAEKERKINISRIKAQQAAELREQLKEKLNPETFDRKAARAEIELRVLKKGDFTVRFNPKLLVARRCSCKNGRNSFRGGTNLCINNSFGGGKVKDKKLGSLS